MLLAEWCIKAKTAAIVKHASERTSATQNQAPAPAADWLLIRQACHRQTGPNCRYPTVSKDHTLLTRSLQSLGGLLQVQLEAHSYAKAKASAS